MYPDRKYDWSKFKLPKNPQAIGFDSKLVNFVESSEVILKCPSTMSEIQIV